MARPLRWRLRVLYPQPHHSRGAVSVRRDGARRAPSRFEPRRSRTFARSCLEVQSRYGRVHLSGPAGRDRFQVLPTIARAEKLVRERFLHEGEDPAVALAPGTPAPAAPSTWPWPSSRRTPRRNQPVHGLAAGVLAAAGARAGPLRGGAEARRRHRPLRPPGGRPVGHAHGAAGRGAAHGLRRQRPLQRSASPELLASAAILGPDEPAPPTAPPRRPPRRRRRGGRGERRGRGGARRGRGGRGRGPRAGRSAPLPTRTRTRRRGPRGGAARGPPSIEDEEEPSRRRTSDEEPRDWVEEEDEEESLGEQPEDPNAAKRFWFEHATGRRQDGRRARLRRGLPDRRGADPHPPAQPRRPVPRRAPRPRLLQAHQPTAAEGRGLGQGPGDGRDLPVVRAQRRRRSRAPTRSSSATRPTPRSARRRARRSATGPARSSSA